jgi:diketogulonate reductase-like aldo/keto reductase
LTPGGPADPIASRVAARLSRLSGQPITPGQATLAWLRTKGIVAVTTSSSEERLRQQRVVFEDGFPFRWTEEEMSAYEAFSHWNGTM